MARIEAYSRTALNDDISMRTEINGEYATLFVDNGFYTLMDGQKIKVGDGHFNLLKFIPKFKQITQSNIQFLNQYGVIINIMQLVIMTHHLSCTFGQSTLMAD